MSGYIHSAHRIHTTPVKHAASHRDPDDKFRVGGHSFPVASLPAPQLAPTMAGAVKSSRVATVSADGTAYPYNVSLSMLPDVHTHIFTYSSRQVICADNSDRYLGTRYSLFDGIDSRAAGDPPRSLPPAKVPDNADAKLASSR